MAIRKRHLQSPKRRSARRTWGRRRAKMLQARKGPHVITLAKKTGATYVLYDYRTDSYLLTLPTVHPTYLPDIVSNTAKQYVYSMKTPVPKTGKTADTQASFRTTKDITYAYKFDNSLYTELRHTLDWISFTGQWRPVRTDCGK